MLINSRGLISWISLSLFFLLCSCATYQGKVSEARSSIVKGDFDSALKKLEPLAAEANGDQLVYLLDYGTTLQMAGKLKESNAVFLKADKLAEMQDFHSVSKIAGSMLLSEEMVQYKGDTFEKIFINAYLAMNYLQLGMYDDALVESRRMNEKYLLYRQDEKKKFELNVFGKYLSAMIWEASHQYDDAYIAYSEAYKIDPAISTIREDLIRTAKLSRRMDDYKSWKSEFADVTEDPRWYDKNLGQLIIIVQQGWGPRKEMSRVDNRIPILVHTPSETQTARVTLNDTEHFDVKRIYDVESSAIQTLNDDMGLLLARRLAAAATKAVVADQVRQKNEVLGLLTWITLRVSDRADLRQWSTLPQSIQYIRIPVKPGKYKVSVQGLTYGSSLTSDFYEDQNVEIKANKSQFIIMRTVH